MVREQHDRTPSAVKVGRAHLPCSDQWGYCQGPFFERDFLSAFNRVREARRSVAPRAIQFDFRQLRSADLLELLSIVCSACWIKRLPGHRVRFTFDERSDAIDNLSAAGFFALLEKLGLRSGRSDLPTVTPEVFLRLATFDDWNGKERARAQVGDALRYYYDWMDANQLLSFDTIVNEALENTIDHAYDASTPEPLPRLIGIRRFDARLLGGRQAWRLPHVSYWLRELSRALPPCDFLDICIVDAGVGIAHRIGPVLKAKLAAATRTPVALVPLDALGALRFVLSAEKSTSAGSKEGKGYGLYKLKNHVQAWGGLFVLRSSTARVIYYPVAHRLDETSRIAFFPGTQVRVLLPILPDRQANIEYVLGKDRDLR
jgi:hypothetical protein